MKRYGEGRELVRRYPRFQIVGTKLQIFAPVRGYPEFARRSWGRQPAYRSGSGREAGSPDEVYSIGVKVPGRGWSCRKCRWRPRSSLLAQRNAIIIWAVIAVVVLLALLAVWWWLVGRNAGM
ncbi:MAG: hypothetical protein ACLSAH_18240 [Bilophila wadsworthia]